MFVLVLLGLGWGFAIEPGMVATRPAELTLPKWPTELDGLKVAVLADLHIGAPHIDLEELEVIVAETNAAKPDVVLVLGDLVIHGVLGGSFVEPEPIAERLAALEAPQGVFAVLGNHDWWYDASRVRRALETAEITVLENEAIRTGAGYWLVGVGDEMTRHAKVAEALGGVTDDAPVLVMTHSPDIFPEIDPAPALTLAGHTHGGQVYLPLLGRLIVPSRFGDRYAAGHIVEDGRHLFVSVGVGTSILPVRFLVPPSADLLTLRASH